MINLQFLWIVLYLLFVRVEIELTSSWLHIIELFIVNTAKVIGLNHVKFFSCVQTGLRCPSFLLGLNVNTQFFSNRYIRQDRLNVHEINRMALFWDSDVSFEVWRDFVSLWSKELLLFHESLSVLHELFEAGRFQFFDIVQSLLWSMHFSKLFVIFVSLSYWTEFRFVGEKFHLANRYIPSYIWFILIFLLCVWLIP